MKTFTNSFCKFSRILVSVLFLILNPSCCRVLGNKGLKKGVSQMPLSSYGQYLMFMTLEWLCIPLETGLWHSRNIKSDLKRMNPGYITLFLSTGVPPPFARWWKSASNHNGSDSYVKYLFSCHIGSVDKNNFRYCHGGGTKNRENKKRQRIWTFHN